MAHLSGLDREAILDFVQQAGESEDVRPFPEAVLDGLRGLVRCDVAAYREWSVAAGLLDRSVSADDADARKRVWTRYPRYEHEDAIPCGAPGSDRLPASDRIGKPLALEDVMSERRFRRTGLYWEICRPFGVRSVLKLYLPNEGARASGFVFDTSVRRFSEHDKLVLERLLPFFLQIRRNARLRARVPRGSRLALLTPREREVLGRAAAGETNAQIAAALVIGPSTVRKHLEHVFEKLDVRNRAQAAALYTASGSDRVVSKAAARA